MGPLLLSQESILSLPMLGLSPMFFSSEVPSFSTKVVTSVGISDGKVSYSVGSSVGILDIRLGDPTLGEAIESEFGTERGTSDGIPGKKNYGKLDISPLLHSLGPRSGTVGGFSDDRSSDGFLGGNVDRNIESLDW